MPESEKDQGGFHERESKALARSERFLLGYDVRGEET